MKLQPRLVCPLLVLTAFLILLPTIVTAQLLPPGDFQGKSLDEWTIDWSKWSIATGLGGQTLPDTVDGVKFLPPNFGGGDFVANLTIPQGTALMVSPFFLFGERYQNGAEDNPDDPIIDQIFEETTFRTTFDGTVLLQGQASDFPDRLSEVVVFPEPIPYTEPQERGEFDSIAAIFGVGIGTIFSNLPLGQHTIRNEHDPPDFLGPPASFTYNITVVPEPASLTLLGSVMAGWITCTRRRVRV
jgi:hypothetical protein